MFITKHRKAFIILSLLLVVASVVLLFVFRLTFGIDFKGGALTEVAYTDARPEAALITDKIKTLEIGEALIQPAGTNEYSIKTRDLTDPEHQALLEALTLDEKYKVEEKSFTSIGPSVGRELVRKALISIILVSLAIILFIAYAFRKVSRPVSSWKYGLITVGTLLHDIIIPIGIFAAISHFNGAEVDTLFVLALLTILGLSVHDKIVVFDRIRENIKEHGAGDFAETVGRSTSQTIVRSINITLTIIFVLIPLYLFGPETTKNFALILTIGLFFGIYSSLFFASPLLVMVEEWQQKKKLK